MIVTVQMSFTTFNSLLLDCSEYCSCSIVLGVFYIITIVIALVCTPISTGKKDVTGHETYRVAVCGPVIHSIFDTWYHKVLWTCR
jgi:hypothetical protein